jgi:MFS family permease
VDDPKLGDGEAGCKPPWVPALAISLTMQTVSAFLTRTLPVIAPELTAAAGVDPQSIGILSGLVAGGTMWFLVGGSLLLSYFGPVRLLQLGVLVGAAAAAATITANWWILLVASFAIGAGYGPSPPAGSEILTRATPEGRRALIMSIKQSGVPLGGAIAGLLQGCILAFFVTQLTTEIGLSLTVAGGAFSAMQLSGTFTRVVMGWLADRLGGLRALMLLAIASSAMVLVLSRVSPGWPVWLVMSVGLAVGTTSTSWNGVYLAEVARLAPPGRIGDATSGSTFFTFGGYLLAPILFALAIPHVGSYGACFVVLALVALLAVPALWNCIRQSPRCGGTQEKH